MKKCWSLLFLMMVLLHKSEAKLVLPKILGHNMVLQQGGPVAIWGWANAGETVTVTFKGQQKKAIADQAGKWSVSLAAMKASFDAQTLTIATVSEAIGLNNILVGEVWFCSGQSNMEFAMRKLIKLKAPAGADWPLNEVAQANNDALRIFLVERKKMNPDTTHSGWAAATAPALGNFSAVGYFFAKEIYNKLKVPVGVISAAIPGSGIEPWMPAEAMLREPFFEGGKSSDAAKKINGDSGKFYTTMVEPVIPFTVKGFLWYQGENNCFLNERLQYSYKMKSLINYWRSKWNNNTLPFYYMQIAPYYYSKAKDRPYTVRSEPEFWEAQAAVLKLKNTVMVATIDLIDDPADLHPVNKWDVSKRLAASTLSHTYKVNKSQAMGPVFKAARINKGVVVIDFNHVGKGLKSNDGKGLNCFEIAGENGVYEKADAIIRNNKVYVSSKNLQNPVSVRFAWKEDAKPNLYNVDGLPALPFRTSHSIIDQFN